MSVPKEMEKKSYCSKKQKETLIELLRLKDNEDLISGKFSQKFSYKDAENKWQKIAATVNAVPGSQKDWKHWKKTWQDIRSKTKKRKTQYNQQLCGTGGGPNLIEITQADENVLDLISPQLISGNENIDETPIFFKFEQSNNESDEENNDPVAVIEAVIETPPQIPTPQKATHSISTGYKKKRTVASNRLQASVQASQNLAKISQERNLIKKKYYERKLELTERQTIAFEKIAHELGNLRLR